MGVMEQLLEEFKKLRIDINELSAAGGGGGPVLIDGKAAIGVNEASEISGIGRNNLIEQTKQGEWPYFKNGIQYKYPVKEFVKTMNEKGIKNMEDIQKEFDYYQSVG